MYDPCTYEFSNLWFSHKLPPYLGTPGNQQPQAETRLNARAPDLWLASACTCRRPAGTPSALLEHGELMENAHRSFPWQWGALRQAGKTRDRLSHHWHAFLSPNRLFPVVYPAAASLILVAFARDRKRLFSSSFQGTFCLDWFCIDLKRSVAKIERKVFRSREFLIQLSTLGVFYVWCGKEIEVVSQEDAAGVMVIGSLG